MMVASLVAQAVGPPALRRSPGRAVRVRCDFRVGKRLLRDAGVRDGRLRGARHTAMTVLLILGVLTSRGADCSAASGHS
ncbi:hypothetical protein SHIRM173S_09915 [Streptomyces hirsutus]